MPEFGYSMQIGKEDAPKFARAQLCDVDASWKDMGQVCGNLKGLSAEKAEALLGKVSKGEFPIRFRAHSKKMGHRGEIGGKKGRYPMKCAKICLQVLRNAVANANSKGLYGELVVVSAAANKQATYPRSAPRGRWRKSNYETTRLEIVLKEVSAASTEESEKRKKDLGEKAARKREAKKAREEGEKHEEMEEEVKGEAKEEKGEKEAQAAPAEEKKEARKEEKKELTPEEKEAEKALERASMQQG